MNNKGFTLVELLVTFMLAAAIIIILFNVLVIIKNNYEETSAKTKLVLNQSTLSNQLNSKFSNNKLVSYNDCGGNFCYSFVFEDGEVIELSVTETKIKFGTYVYVLAPGDKVVDPSISIESPYLVIKIPIKAKFFPKEDYGVNVVYRRG